MRIVVVYIMYFASGAKDSGSTKSGVTPAGGVMAGIWDRSIPAKADMLGDGLFDHNKGVKGTVEPRCSNHRKSGDRYSR